MTIRQPAHTKRTFRTSGGGPDRQPLLLLDVDGVLLPIGSEFDEAAIAVAVAGRVVRFSSALPGRLAALGERFELVWASGWGEAANELLAPLWELPSPSVIGVTAGSRAGAGYKLGAVRAYVGDAPLAWVDDAFGSEVYRWAGAPCRADAACPGQPSLGLGDATLAALVRFADAIDGQREPS